MIGGIVEIAENGRYLSLHRGFLIVKTKTEELGRVPLDDITALILSAQQVSISKNVMNALLERKSIIITTGPNWHPSGVTLPMTAHHGHAGILQHQIQLSEPKKKRLWQSIVKAKITNQKDILTLAGADENKIRELGTLAKRVKSGDPENMEAQASRHYWPALMGTQFKRDRKAEDHNILLNYGYTILRAATARYVVASGLHPALGLHHKSSVNSFALIDDLMEPFRPVFDWKVFELQKLEKQLEPETKRSLVSILTMDLKSGDEVSPLINCLGKLAQSLIHCIKGTNDKLRLPNLIIHPVESQ